MARRDVGQRGTILTAGSEALRAAWFEGASVRLAGPARVAFDQAEVFDPHPPGIGDRDRPQQSLGIGVARAAADDIGRPDLDDLPEIHDRDAIANAFDDPEIVRHKNIRQPELLLDVLDQPQDLRADRHIERRNGFVEDDDVWLRMRARAMAMRWHWPPENSWG